MTSRSLVAGRIEQNVWLTFVGTNAVGVFVMVVGVLAGRAVLPRDWENSNAIVAQVIGLGVVWFAMATVVSRFTVRATMRKALAWLGTRPSPNEKEQRALYLAPTMIALQAIPWWGLAAIWMPSYVRATGNDFPARLVAKGIGLLFLGFVFSNSIGFLLLERRLRPVFALALRAENLVEPVGLGVVRRMLVVWFATSAAPLIAVSVQPWASTAQERSDIWSAVLVVTIGASVGGLVVTVLSARALQEPLRAMRAALGRVERGELDVEIEVADATELGLVQAGFNRTVQSLRERDRLRELFGHHVGTDVAERALASEQVLGGEIRKVSVLFVDVIASTALSQRQAPSTVVNKLNAFFDAVVTAVEAEGGWVNKFEGDAALCVFGAPGELQNHAEGALRAAVAMRTAITKLGKRYGDIDAAIGVATGEVVAGNIGAVHRYEYTVIGDAVNEASRLTEEAKLRPQRVLATADTIAAAGNSSWSRVGRKTFRGRAEPTVFFTPA